MGRKTLGVTDAPTVELLLDSGAVNFNGTQWSAIFPHIVIFDGTFVTENVHSGEFVDVDQKRGLYRVIVGSDGVALAEEELRFATESREKTGEISAAEKLIKPRYSPWHEPGAVSCVGAGRGY